MTEQANQSLETLDDDELDAVHGSAALAGAANGSGLICNYYPAGNAKTAPPTAGPTKTTKGLISMGEGESCGI